MIELGVNIDHVATIRQARKTYEPEPVWAAVEAHLGGADGITVHLREDRRHIQDADVYAIRQMCTRRLNLELAATDEMVGIACDVLPNDACVVPEKREELTTEGGLDIIGQFERVRSVTQRLNAANIRVSLFIEPDIEQIRRVPDIGAPVIELHTGTYANATGEARQRELNRIREATEFAHSLGIQVNAGHGLDYHNTQAIAAIANIRELNIGHSMVARAVFVGIRQATLEMLALMQAARAGA